MSTPDGHDEVGDLLHQGYAADVDRGFAGSLLTRLQEEMRPRPMRRWMVGGAIAAGAAILFGVAAIARWMHARPSAPTLAVTPTDGAGPLVVRGRMLRWDAPIAEFAVTQVIQGEVNAATVYVDLSADLGAMRRHAYEALAKGAATAPAEAAVSARAATLFASQLNVAAGTEMVLELGPPSAGRRPARGGRILSWAGVCDLPRWDRHYDMDRTVINVVDDGFASAMRPRPGELLRDEWGMPR